MDTTDITVWCQLASMASSLGNLLLARKALEQALCCHSDYWPAIESLCTVLLALGDFPCKQLHTIPLFFCKSKNGSWYEASYGIW